MTDGQLRNEVDPAKFNSSAEVPYSLRLLDFQAAMQDVYDLFYDVNGLLLARGLRRLDEMLRPAAMSGVVWDLLTASLASHARSSRPVDVRFRLPGRQCDGTGP